MILPVVAFLLLAGVLVWQIHDSNATVELIQQSDRRIALATRIEKFVVDEESGLRGYQTTSDPRFLQPYYTAQAPMQEAIAQLQSMANGPAPHLQAFILEHNTWHTSFAEPLIITIRAGGTTNDVDLTLTGKTSMDSMRAHLDAIVSASEQRRIDRIDEWHHQKRLVLAILIGLALGIGIVIGLFTRNRLETVSAAFSASLDLERHRARLRKMDDAELKQHGKGCAFLCSPEQNFGKPPLETFVIQLQ